MSVTKIPTTPSFLASKKKKTETIPSMKDPFLDDELFIDLTKTLKHYEMNKSRKTKNKVFTKLYSISVNFWDILGLLDICPCGTIHSIKPYISYN